MFEPGEGQGEPPDAIDIAAREVLTLSSALLLVTKDAGPSAAYAALHYAARVAANFATHSHTPEEIASMNDFVAHLWEIVGIRAVIKPAI